MKFRPIIVDEYIEYEQCLTKKEIDWAIKHNTYHKHFDGRAFRKTFREKLCEWWFGLPYYRVFKV